ncbi:DUF1835 domain-containing protein [Antarcticibacterium flavum]|uniref:DUF1835 domain-containing protein n=1 Tax=Antarcticibacterium flavum TaxID=2058175 RepID=A0A5B7X0L0_9FLAO|nr:MULTISPECIES: DUF1835 domain-containing protein [Antarcticibacterium]MCM4158864.1 DUF1835 domain-containing protein [Antarcticibacterium sp. W02-3]QCY68123.1 DUF1835 domain-containing protein [Antarcticibacterium flavum]
MAEQLHIINGDDLHHNFLELEIPGDIVVWREMLCEGPTSYELDTDEFLKLRTGFLYKHYQITAEDYNRQFIEELHKLKVSNSYDEIVLWFEFDLFSHINMLAVISFLQENKKNIPVSLVCSKRLKGEKEFTPLSQLSMDNLKNHYEQRIPLNEDDLEMANLMWQLYNGDNPQRLIGQIKTKTNFEYLSACIRAHLERFPNSRTGLNSLEHNVLKLIEKNNITSFHHLIGYTLEYQGYFGFGDLQVERIINHLKLFFEERNGIVVLTPAGIEALNFEKNFYQHLKDEEYLGGVRKYDFLYDSTTHKILKL